MSVIVNPIGPRAFELIRDRVGEILIEELSNQSAISYNENLDATVYIERSIAFTPAEMPCVNVTLSRGEFDNATILKKVGTYNYNIDCFTRSVTTDEQDGDALSMFKLHQLMGVIDAILSDTKYLTLGFVPPFISGVAVNELSIAEPKRTEDSHSVMMGRLSLVVMVPENVELLEGVLIDGFDTQVKIGETEQGFIYSGDNIPVPPPTVPGGKVFNSLNVELGEAPSGGIFVVDDSQYLISDTYGQTLYNGSLPATNSLNQTIQDSVITNSDVSYTKNVFAEDSLIVPDEDITLNSGVFLTKPSVKDQDIILQDQNSDPIVPDSIAGNTITVNVPVGSSGTGDTILKTGETISYGTGSDGDEQRGREVDLDTLSSNNPFGNTNRFTDELGLGVYANDIAIDWTTFNGDTVLGYYRSPHLLTGGDFAYALDFCLNTFTTGGFTGWHQANENELRNIRRPLMGAYFDYPPFNIPTGRFFHTSTTNPDVTTTSMYHNYQNYRFQTFSKTSNAGLKPVPVRVFTVTGTVLT